MICKNNTREKGRIQKEDEKLINQKAQFYEADR